ncbi:MAG: hypothetical protein ABIL89_03545 [candidate division WOR-3 bacterium]
MRYINIYLSTTPEDRADRPPRYILNFKNLKKEIKEYENELEEIENLILNPYFLENEGGLPVYSIALFLDIKTKNLEIRKLPFKLPNKIIISRKPYINFINYLESEFGRNLIVNYSHKNLKIFIVDSKGIHTIEEDLSFTLPYIESGVYKTTLKSSSKPVVRTIGGQNIENVISEYERKISKYILQRIEEIVNRFKIDRIFISTPDEKSGNLVLSYFPKYIERMFFGFLRTEHNNKEQIFRKLIEKLEEIDIKEEEKLFEEFREKLGNSLATIGIENVVKHALMYNIRTLIVNLNFHHNGYVCHSNGLFYHKEFDFPCEDIEVLKDITDYLIDFVIENGGNVEIAHTLKLNELISNEIGAILRFRV